MSKPATILRLLIMSLTILAWHPATGGASANFVMKGRILDVGGNPVEGGEIFVYDTPRTRRPADFISPKSGRDGLYRLEIPAGTYWVVARVRNGAKYGPLITGGRHSGEALEIEAAAGEEMALDFTVADVREMARSLRKAEDDFRNLSGRILDRDGKPVRGAYAFARGEKNDHRLPDFISPWSDTDGRYSLRLPAGRYRLGAATAYPPEEGAPTTEIVLDSIDPDAARDIRITAIAGKTEAGERNTGEND